MKSVRSRRNWGPVVAISGVGARVGAGSATCAPAGFKTARYHPPTGAEGGADPRAAERGMFSPTRLAGRMSADPVKPGQRAQPDPQRPQIRRRLPE